MPSPFRLYRSDAEEARRRLHVDIAARLAALPDALFEHWLTTVPAERHAEARALRAHGQSAPDEIAH